MDTDICHLSGADWIESILKANGVDVPLFLRVCHNTLETRKDVPIADFKKRTYVFYI